jgi:hypothetical protein
VTRWALFLIATYVTLGLSPLAPPKAIRLAFLLTAAVLFAVMVKLGGGG